MSKTNGHSVAGTGSVYSGSMTKEPGLHAGSDVYDSRNGGTDTFMERAVAQVETTGSAILAFTTTEGNTNGN